MTTSDADEQLFRFDSPGTLPKPGPIGRVIRLLVGVYLLWNEYLLFAHVGPDHIPNITVLIWLAVTVWLAPYVVNIGWGVRWGMWPRVGLVGLWLVGGLLDWWIHGTLPGPASWFTLKWTSLYVMGHLGLSFCLSAVIATPGCEMRAIPHLVGLVTGRARAEHYCPGFLDRLDRWERGRWSRPDGDGSA